MRQPRTDIIRPGIGSGGWNRLKTYCVHGHPLSGKNLRINCRGERCCKICYRTVVLCARKRLKEKLFKLLGGKCSWPGCEIHDLDMLTLDHIRNDGAKLRIRGATNSESVYRRALREGAPRNRYQALCANHNLKKEIQRQHAARL